MPSRSGMMDLVTDSEPEIVFAVVAPVGTDIDECETKLKGFLGHFKYKTKVISLSERAEKFPPDHGLLVNVDRSSEFSRISSLMNAGNAARRHTGYGGTLALQAVMAISESRTERTDPRTGITRKDPFRRTAHFLRSLKHPAEVEVLRRVYGPGFFLIAINSSPRERLEYLTQWGAMTEAEAEDLLARDEREEDKLGQQTRDTFALADVFIRSKHYEELARFLEIVFGEPFHTPTQDEHAMFLAYAASLRSAQLARQVGAVIVSREGEVISTGVNEVPKSKGGTYWPGKNDCRDHVVGRDSNDHAIDDIVTGILGAVHPHLAKGVDLDRLREEIKRTKVGDITEFGRVVHAEMEALITCARVGVSPRGGTLFATTYPCHNCAKHIVAAGVERVVFVEPYPKSRATTLHDDSITDEGAEGKVSFEPFIGVAARRYFDLFSMVLGSGAPLKRKVDGKPVTLNRKTAVPRFRMSPFGYFDREKVMVQHLMDDILAPLAAPSPDAPKAVSGSNLTTRRVARTSPIARPSPQRIAGLPRQHKKGGRSQG